MNNDKNELKYPSWTQTKKPTDIFLPDSLVAKTGIKAPVVSKSSTASKSTVASKPLKSTTRQVNTTNTTSTKNNKKSLYEQSELAKTVDKWLAFKNGNSQHTAGRMTISPGRQTEVKAKELSEKNSISTKENNNIGNFANWLGSNTMKGVSTFNKELMEASDFYMPTECLGDYDIFSNLNKYYSDIEKYYDKASNDAAEKMGGNGWHLGGDIVSSITDNVLSTGLSNILGANSKLGSALEIFDDYTYKNLLKDYINNIEFFQNIGVEYEKARENGADNIEATATAIVVSLINSGLDKSGIDLIASGLKDKSLSKAVKQVGNFIDNGLVGVLKGTSEPSVAKLIYDETRPIYSTAEENAIVNPYRISVDFASESLSDMVKKTSEEWSDIVRKWSDEEFDKYINGLKGE